MFLQKIVASNRTAADAFGRSVSIDGDRIVVGAEYADTNNTNFGGPGAAYIFKRNANNVWEEEQIIVSTDLGYSDHFGCSVSISGETVVIGSYGEEEDGLGNNTIERSGSAYVFELNSSGNWYQKQKLVASDRGWRNEFGLSVAIDKKTIVCGARGNLQERGSAYIFEKNSTGFFVQTERVVSDSAINGDNFGSSVAVDSNTVVVGAYLKRLIDPNDPARGTTGSAYVFQKSVNGSWRLEKRLAHSTPRMANQFGFDVAIDYPNVIVTGFAGTGVCGSDTNIGSGAVYLFKRIAPNQWIEADNIIARNGVRNTYFGRGISIDGSTILIGDPDEEKDENGANTITSAGAAYFYTTPGYHVSVKENKVPISYSVFPNPNTGKCTLQLEKEQDLTSIFISDINGRVIKEITPKKTLNYEIHFEGTSGIYFLNILSENASKTIKLIKK